MSGHRHRFEMVNVKARGYGGTYVWCCTKMSRADALAIVKCKCGEAWCVDCIPVEPARTPATPRTR